MESDGLADAKVHLTSNAVESDIKTDNITAKSASAKQAPNDKGYAVYLTFLLYGIGGLLPFNVIMACLDFYEKTMPEYLTGNYWPFVINGPSLAIQVLIVAYG